MDIEDRRSAEPPKAKQQQQTATASTAHAPRLGDEDEGDDDMAAMQAMMGFGGFGTTKGQKVAGNNTGSVHKDKKTEYRQYMNRQGGFNRPLSPSR